MYKVKILTHIIRLSDGHVIPDWIDVKKDENPKDIKDAVKRGAYDTDNYCVRMRRYPVTRHEIDVELWDKDRFVGSPRRMW